MVHVDLSTRQLVILCYTQEQVARTYGMLVVGISLPSLHFTSLHFYFFRAKVRCRVALSTIFSSTGNPFRLRTWLINALATFTPP